MKKKILFVNGHLNVGGVEKSLIDILKNFNYEEYEVDLILFEGLGDYYNELPNEVNLHFLDITSTYGSYIECIKKCLKKKDWFTFFMKIILILSSKINQKFLKLARPLLKINKYYDCAIAFRVGFCGEVVGNCVNSKKKICWWHHGECQYSEKTRKRMIETFDMFDTIVSVSKGCQLMIENYFGNLTNKTIVIPNMIDIESIENKAKLFNPYLNDEHEWKFITVGRLSLEKHVDNVVYIANELLQQGFNNFIWYVVGDGPEKDKIKQLINEYNIKNYIKLIGSKNNPYPYIYYADLLIHTSLVESQCLTVLEGLTLQKPCIVTRSIGPEEFIDQHKNGILTTKDPSDISKEVLLLSKNKKLKEILICNSLKTVQRTYSIEIIMKKIYDSIN
ncbi:glycosyltransferase [Thomasclavelia cocleata]|uniref:glycosyltransferase n=1 Tax=Thomasclavelia cocleata TaxID=69824 RepID=UPI00242CB29B|nr:glycosyltransferase [Thomasclavelia cocleata]